VVADAFHPSRLFRPGYNPAETMGLEGAFESLLQMGKSKPPQGEGPTSIVLLLRQPHFPTLEQLREAAGRAFGVAFASGRNSRHSVYQRGVIFTLANVGAHTLSFLFQTRAYFADNREHARAFEESLHRDDQRQAWAEHSAYAAIDYVKGDANVDSQYVVLARLCAELYNDNCPAIYLPGASVLVPGEATIRRQLSKIIAYREVDVS
jgi:hypothetical protein